MDGRFLKFKSRLSKIRLTKSVMAGLAAAFAFAGISLLLWDFGLLKMSPWICACIGFGAGCLAFAVLFMELPQLLPLFLLFALLVFSLA